MLLFDRVIQISVGAAGSSGLAVSGLRCSFDITKTEESKENKVNFSVWNLSAATRAEFDKIGNRVIISAGYAAGGLQTLAVGDILAAETDFSPPEIKTDVEAADGGKALRTARTSVSYKAGTPAKSIVEELVGKLDVDMPDIPVDLSGAFAYGWSHVGRVRDALDQLARRFGFSWSIQNNALQITETQQPSQRQAVILSADTGLIGTPTPIDDVRSSDEKSRDESSSGGSAENDNSAMAKLAAALGGQKMERPGLRATSLLNPALIPGDPVIIRSRFRGERTYRIKSVRHRGDTHGSEWYSEVECVEAS